MDPLSLAFSLVGLVLAVALVHPRQASDAIRGWLRPVRRLLPEPSSPRELAELAGLSHIEIGNQFFREPLGPDRLTARYEDDWTAFPAAHVGLLRELLDQERARARQNGQTLDNNLGYSLRRVEVSRPQTANGERRNTYTLVLGPSDYDHFVVPNTVLDREVVDPRTQERVVLRELLGLGESTLSLAGLDRLPFHFRVGTGAMVQTADGYWVLSVRSNRQFVAPDLAPDCLRLHVSAAEGMLRAPTLQGGDTRDGHPDPFRTVERALDDELNLSAGRDYAPTEIACIGYYLDRSRAQLFLAFLVRSRQLTLRTVFERWTETPVDRHENYAILAVRATAENAARLLRGHDLTPEWVRAPGVHEAWLWGHGRRRSVLASNHARTVLAACAVATCGLTALRTDLEAAHSAG